MPRFSSAVTIRKTIRAKGPIFSGLLLLAVLSAVNGCRSRLPDPLPFTFNGPSTDLKHTQITTAFDETIQEGKNAIWCVSFQAAFEVSRRERGVAEGAPVALAQSEGQSDVQAIIPAGSLYAETGRWRDGVADKIRQEMPEHLPYAPLPEFSDMSDDALVSYSFLEAGMDFPQPYFQNYFGLQFDSSRGSTSTPKVHSFGFHYISHTDMTALREQPRILFRRTIEEPYPHEEFAVDLWAASSPTQLVVARIDRKETLAQAFAYVREQAEVYRNEPLMDGDTRYVREHFVQNDQLYIPNMLWIIRHTFTGSDGGGGDGSETAETAPELVRSDLEFKLGNINAELRPETQIFQQAIRFVLVFDRPFLVYMKRRDADTPYFAMWVDNTELLQAW